MSQARPPSRGAGRLPARRPRPPSRRRRRPHPHDRPQRRLARARRPGPAGRLRPRAGAAAARPRRRPASPADQGGLGGAWDSTSGVYRTAEEWADLVDDRPLRHDPLDRGLVGARAAGHAAGGDRPSSSAAFIFTAPSLLALAGGLPPVLSLGLFVLAPLRAMSRKDALNDRREGWPGRRRVAAHGRDRNGREADRRRGQAGRAVEAAAKLVAATEGEPGTLQYGPHRRRRAVGHLVLRALRRPGGSTPTPAAAMAEAMGAFGGHPPRCVLVDRPAKGGRRLTRARAARDGDLPRPHPRRPPGGRRRRRPAPGAAGRRGAAPSRCPGLPRPRCGRRRGAWRSSPR